MPFVLSRQQEKALFALTADQRKPALWLLLLPDVSHDRKGVALAGMALLIVTRLVLAEDFLPRASFLNIVGLAKHLGALWPVLGWLVLSLARPPVPRDNSQR